VFTARYGLSTYVTEIHIRFVVKGINCFILTQELELLTDISGALSTCKLQFCCLVRFSLKKILLLSNIQVIAMVSVFCLMSYPCVSYILYTVSCTQLPAAAVQSTHFIPSLHVIQSAYVGVNGDLLYRVMATSSAWRVGTFWSRPEC
jgi:hypothetical protein